VYVTIDIVCWLYCVVSTVFISFELLIIKIVCINGPFLSSVFTVPSPPMSVYFRVGLLLLMSLRRKI